MTELQAIMQRLLDLHDRHAAHTITPAETQEMEQLEERARAIREPMKAEAVKAVTQ